MSFPWRSENYQFHSILIEDVKCLVTLQNHSKNYFLPEPFDVFAP